MNMNAHSSVICDSQKVEATQMSMDGWLNRKKSVIATQWSIIQPQKGMQSDTCYNMNNPLKQYAKWNKPDTKRQLLHDSTYMRSL